jgi:hypothetical protein
VRNGYGMSILYPHVLKLHWCLSFLTLLTYTLACRLGGIVVSVLATGPKDRGFIPGRGGGFLRAIKIGSTPPFGCDSRAGVPVLQVHSIKIHFSSPMPEKCFSRNVMC